MCPPDKCWVMPLENLMSKFIYSLTKSSNVILSLHRSFWRFDNKQIYKVIEDHPKKETFEMTFQNERQIGDQNMPSNYKHNSSSLYHAFRREKFRAVSKFGRPSPINWNTIKTVSSKVISEIVLGRTKHVSLSHSAALNLHNNWLTFSSFGTWARLFEETSPHFPNQLRKIWSASSS